MRLTSNKPNTQVQTGFTIVELLIVVVVIAILAAITIVSYNGITARANSSSAAAMASSVQKKAELYLNDDDSAGSYPKSLSLLTDSSKSAKAYYIPSTSVGVTGATAINATDGKTKVQLLVCGTPSGVAASKTTVTGLQIKYWDFSGAAIKTTNVGDITGGSGGDCTAALL